MRCWGIHTGMQAHSIKSSYKVQVSGRIQHSSQLQVMVTKERIALSPKMKPERLPGVPFYTTVYKMLRHFCEKLQRANEIGPSDPTRWTTGPYSCHLVTPNDLPKRGLL